MKVDIRDELFEKIKDKVYIADLISENSGIISGINDLIKYLESNKIDILYSIQEGSLLNKGSIICTFKTTPKKMAIAEEILAGFVSKTSGIATAANYANQISNGAIKIISGSFKKIPKEQKQIFRRAMETGGIQTRITSDPFIYIDKNYITMLGGIPAALNAARVFTSMKKVIQIHNIFEDVKTEAAQAVKGGADILMVDTGKIDDIKIVKSVIKQYKEDIELAFSGNVKTKDIPKFIDMGVDRLCIGRDIIDAPMLDVKLDVRKCED